MSEERAAVVLALTPIAERAVEPLLFGDGAAVTPIESVAEADELERCARQGGAAAILLSPALPGLTAAHCERARAAGLRLVGIALDEHDERALAELAVDTIVAHDAPADALLASLRNGRREPEPPPPPAVLDAGRDDRRGGTVLAVVGCKGSPGASECAASLAALASQRWPALLVEIDALGGGLDLRIGSDPQRGSLLALVRAAATGEALPELIERWIAHAPGWPPILLAPPHPAQALPELSQAGAVSAALRALRATVPLTICDVGFLLATGEEIPQAARVHREALVCADAVLLVLGARDAHQRPGLAQLDLLLGPLGIPAERLRIAINGIGGPGAASELALQETLAPRLAERGLSADAWLAWDTRALERAARKGLPLALAHRHGPYARVLANLLDELFLPATPRPRPRKHKLAPPPPQHTDAEEEVALPWRR